MPIRPRPIPASDPSNPACGTIFCTHPPKNEKTTLMMPIITMVAIPRYQVIIAASCSDIPSAFMPTKAGPRTTSAMPIVEGVSSPSGMAVTSLLPVRFASRKAIQV